MLHTIGHCHRVFDKEKRARRRYEKAFAMAYIVMARRSYEKAFAMLVMTVGAVVIAVVFGSIAVFLQVARMPAHMSKHMSVHMSIDVFMHIPINICSMAASTSSCR